MKAPCEHTIRSEKRDSRKLPRFVESYRSMTLEEALDAPLAMNSMPFDVDTLSPTPLDPYSLEVFGALNYANAAREYMIEQLHVTTRPLADSHAKLLERAEQEIADQHIHRMQKNDDAMRQWKEVAATNSSNTVLSHRDAEGVMQVRAGIAQPSAIIELLSRNPQMGGIEVAKATRPFCFTAYSLAKQSLTTRLNRLTRHDNFPEDFAINDNVAPYRHNIFQENASLIFKSKIGAICLDGVDLELINRDSAVMYHPEQTASVPEAKSLAFGPHQFEAAFVDTTTYIRVKS